MKLFMYHDSNKEITRICAINNSIAMDSSLCNAPYSTSHLDDINAYLETYKYFFCRECTRILKTDYKTGIKQLAINQKLGIKT